MRRTGTDSRDGDLCRRVPLENRQGGRERKGFRRQHPKAMHGEAFGRMVIKRIGGVSILLLL